MKTLPARKEELRARLVKVLSQRASLEQHDEEKDFELAVTVFPESQAPEDIELQSLSHDKLIMLVTHLKKKVASHKQVLRDLFYRSQPEITESINEYISDMDTVTPGYLHEYIRQRYPFNFWYSEPDANFKYQLATALYNKAVEINSSFRNNMLESIVNKRPEANGLMASWIEE